MNEDFDDDFELDESIDFESLSDSDIKSLLCKDKEDLQKLKIIEDLLRSKQKRMIVAGELCHKQRVLEIVQPVVLRCVDILTTMPQTVTPLLVGLDSDAMYDALTEHIRHSLGDIENLLHAN